ncbi:hypothetical protein [Enterococcus sp. CSURQ0835]|uniref:hypothetical protein n=1 Tax=Enterococcus sp. CSURQ0835 TaxID=2681394 RepID=UPI001357A538|nr:hypothetical protein [Enterococcus sp. CSURQ0835]
MKKQFGFMLLFFNLFVGIISFGGVLQAQAAATSANSEINQGEGKLKADHLIQDAPIYRLYNPNSGEHLFTPSLPESITLSEIGWKAEGVAFHVAANRSDALATVKRVYNPVAGDHHYTVDDNEVSYLVQHGWLSDDLAFNTAGEDGQAVYRLYNPNAVTGTHHFTLAMSERDQLLKLGWKDEGVAFNAYGRQTLIGIR